MRNMVTKTSLFGMERELTEQMKNEQRSEKLCLQTVRKGQIIKTEVRYVNKTVTSLLRESTFLIHVNTNLLMPFGNNRCLL